MTFLITLNKGFLQCVIHAVSPPPRIILCSFFLLHKIKIVKIIIFQKKEKWIGSTYVWRLYRLIFWINYQFLFWQFCTLRNVNKWRHGFRGACKWFCDSTINYIKEVDLGKNIIVYGALLTTLEMRKIFWGGWVQ